MGILIRNNIVNQKGNPAWYEDTLANRPTANLQGRMFVDTNNPSTGIYRDTGSSWVAVADPGAGTTGTLQQVTTNGSTTNVGISITTLTPGSVLFSGIGGLISQDNTNLFWDDTNNFLGIGPTGGPSALLDIHSATQNIFIQVNATSTNNSQVAFLNGGVGKWRIGNLYNASANDFIIYDTTNALSRLTIKNTGQTFIGSDTTSSGLFVVNSATSDNHIVVLGANGPSLRLRNSGTSPTLNVGLGISTAANNFIQGSVSGNYCIFNASTTASPILFGVYDSGSGNTVEAVRISATRNFLVGGTSDSGQKLQITGTALISSSVTANNYFLTGMTAGSGALYFNSSGNRVTVANYNASGVVEIETNSGTLAATFDASQNLQVVGTISGTSGTFTGQLTGTGDGSTTASIISNNASGASGVAQYYQDYKAGSFLCARVFRGNGLSGTVATGLNIDNYDGFQIRANQLGGSGGTINLLGGNCLIGTVTNSGYTLDVNGISRFSGYILSGQTGTAYSPLHTKSSGGGDNSGLTIENTGSGGAKFYIWPTATINGEGANKLIFASATNSNILIIDGATSSSSFGGQVNINNTVSAAVSVSSTHKVSILIGGVQYYLLASNI